MALVTQKDTTFTKIFVGGLPYHTTDASLREFFENFGEIEEAVVITDRQTGKSRGYGFVTMTERAAAERACKEANPVIDGRKANVNLAYLGAKPRGITTPALPLTLKAGYPASALAGIQGQYGVPQYIYPSALVAASPTTAGVVPAGLSQSPLSPTTGAGYFDYTAYANQVANQYAEAAAGYPFGAQSYAAAQAAYTYGIPQPLSAGSAAAAALYQPQQLQERLQ